ncbi:MAG: ABC transporter permease [Chloroflexota bacterium]|jgi:ABC-2 type transport system permease protein
MKKTWLIMTTEIRTTLGRKSFLLLGFGFPVLLAIIALAFMIANRDGGGTVVEVEPQGFIEEGYVDPAGLIHSLPENVPDGWLVPFADEAAAQRALEAGEIQGYYLISPDYLESGDVQYVTESFDPLSGSIRMQPMEWVLLYNLSGGDVSMAAALWQPLNVEMHSLAPPRTEEGYEDNWFVEVLPTFMTVILYMVILIAAQTLTAAVGEEKKNRVMEILLSSVTPTQFIGGKILALGFLGLLMFAAYVGVMWMVVTFGGQPLGIPLDYELPTGLLIWATLFAVLGYAMYGSLTAGLGALAPDVKDTRSTSILLISPLIVAYMLNVVVVAVPNGVVAVFLSLFPLSSPVSMISRMTVIDVPAWQLILAAALQLAMALAIVRLVARLFRAQVMLSGAAPTPGRYLRVLFGRE